MFTRKTWIAVAFVSLNAVFAQQTPKTHVTVQVTDVSGARVPRATVEVTPSAIAQTLRFEADWKGEAGFELPPGGYRLLVKSQGFCPYKQSFSFQNHANQLIEAKLQIDSCPGPCGGHCIEIQSDPIEEDTVMINTESYVLTDAITLRPLKTMPLTARPTRKHS